MPDFWTRTIKRRQREEEERRRAAAAGAEEQKQARLKPITSEGVTGPWSPEVLRHGMTRTEGLLTDVWNPYTNPPEMPPSSVEGWLSDMYTHAIGQAARQGKSIDEAMAEADVRSEQWIQDINEGRTQEYPFHEDPGFLKSILGTGYDVLKNIDSQLGLARHEVRKLVMPETYKGRTLAPGEYVGEYGPGERLPGLGREPVVGGILKELPEFIEEDLMWRESKERQRPLIRELVKYTVEQPFLAGENLLETLTTRPTVSGQTTSVPAKGKVRGPVSRVAEEVAAETMHPVAIAMVFPFAGQMTAGKSGAPLVAQVFSNLIGTGLEPGAARLMMQGATAGVRLPARVALKGLARGTVQAVSDEGAWRLAAGYKEVGDPGTQEGLLRAFSRAVMSGGEDPYELGRQLGKITREGFKETDDAETLAALAGRTPRTGEDPLGRLTSVDELLDETERVAAANMAEQLGDPTGRPVIPATNPVHPNPGDMTTDVRYLLASYRAAMRNGDSLGAHFNDITKNLLKDFKIEKGGLVSMDIAQPLEAGQSRHWNDVLSFPDDYHWTSPAYRRMADGYHDLVLGIVEKGVDNGLFPKVFLKEGLRRGRYVPRFVVQVGEEELTVGMRRGRVGLKQTHQLPRTRPRAGEAGKVPVKYLDDPAASISEFSREVDYRIASNGLQEGMDEYSKTVRASEATVNKLEEANQRFTKAQEEVGRLKNLRKDLRKMEENALARGKKKLAGEYADQQTATVLEEDGWKTELAKARKQRDKWKVAAAGEKSTFGARHPELSYLGEPFAGGKMYPKKVIEEYKAGMRLPGGWMKPVVSTLEVMRSINSIFKPVWAAGDLSFTALQTAPSLGVNPAAWLEMMAIATGSLADPQIYYHFMAKRAPLVQRMIADGVPLYGSEFGVEAMKSIKGAKLFLKTAGRPLQWGSDAWNRSLNTMSVLLYEQGEKMIDEIGGPTFSKLVGRIFGPGVIGKGKPAKKQLAAVISHGTGRLTTEEMGKRGPMANLALQALPFAGQYWEGYARLIGDAVRGGMSGNLGRRMLAGWAATGVGLYTGLAYATGQKPMLNPMEDGAKLMTIRIGDRRVGIGGPLQQMLLLAGRVADDPKNAPEIVKRFLRGKASPSLSLFGDLILLREDFLGYKLDSWEDRLSYLTSRTVPFAFQDVMQEISEDLLAGEGLERTMLDPEKFAPTNIIPEFLGGRSFPVSKRQIYQETGVEEWRANNPDWVGTDEDIHDLLSQGVMDDKDEYPMTHAAGLEMDEEQRKRASNWQLVADNNDKFEADVTMPRLLETGEKIRWGLPGGGENYIEQRKLALNAQHAHNENMPAELGLNPDALPEKETREAKVVQQIRELDLENFPDPSGIGFDWDAFELAKQKLLVQLSLEVRKEYEKPAWESYEDPEVASNEKRVYEVKKALDTWFEFPKYKGLTNAESDTVDAMIEWAGLQREQYLLVGESVKTDYFLEWLITSQPGDAGLASYARVANSSKLRETTINPQKRQWTLAHPDLAVFYGFTYENMDEEGQAEWQRRYSLRQ